MMLDITRARQNARPVECDCDADRGSDPGDASEFDACDSDTEDMCTASDIEDPQQVHACTDNLDDGLTCGVSP